MCTHPSGRGIGQRTQTCSTLLENVQFLFKILTCFLFLKHKSFSFPTFLTVGLTALLVLANLVDIKWYLILIYIFLITSRLNIFSFISSSDVFFCVFPVQIFSIFSIVFFLLIFRSLHILENVHLLIVSYKYVLPVGCLLTWVIFILHRSFRYMDSFLPDLCFLHLIKEILLALRTQTLILSFISVKIYFSTIKPLVSLVTSTMIPP